jgi:alpha-ketoglutarate-dependent taurine dioxygenase
MPAETLPGLTLEPLAPFALLVRPDAGPVPLEGLPIERLRPLLLQHRLLVLRGFSPCADKDGWASYCRRWGPLLEWDFGFVFEVVEHAAPKNYLFTSGSVPYHWDGAFARQVPWLQMFQCVEAPGEGQGGETLFCDTARVCADASPEDRERWQNVEIEYATEKVAHYGGKIRAALVARHPLTGETTLRFNEPANAATVRLNTPELVVHGLPPEQVEGFLNDMQKRLYDPRNAYAHAWRPGDVVITDNHVLLHGRAPYRGGLPRRLWRVHVLSPRCDQ